MSDAIYQDEGARARWQDVAVPVVQQRRRSQSDLVRQCIEIANRYNADIAVPVIGTDSDTATPVLSPALVNEAIDVPAIRASSTNPAIMTPWLADTGAAKDRATARRKILASTYHRSRWDRGRRRFFRHVAGYAMGAIVVIPDEETRSGVPLARMALRNPLTTYADPQNPEDLDLPADVGFVHQLSASALRKRYPRCRAEYGGQIPAIGQGQDPVGELYDVLEWIDDDFVLIGILGRSFSSTRPSANQEPMGNPQLLSWYPNRTGLVPAICPTIITLDKIVSRLTHMIGKADLLSYLWQLDIAQTQKAMAPDRYVIAGDDMEPEIVSNGGRWIDGRTGEVNLLKGVRQVGELRGAPDPMNLQRMQALERNARQETGLIGAVTGETNGYSGSLRTGRGIDSLMSASVDPAIAELQEIGANALTVLNEAIFAVYATYWPSRKFVVFSGWAGDRGMCTFTPSTDIDTRENLVYYPLPGTDAYAQTVQLSQMVQAEMMSRNSARRMHPWIDDPEAEERMLSEERIDSLTWQALAQRASQGGIPPIDAAELITQIKKGLPIEEAIIAADDAARKRQATATDAEGAPQAQPPVPGAPEAQPGLGTPGEGSEAGAAAPQGQLDPQALLAALQAAPQSGPAPGAQFTGRGPALPVPQGAPA